MRQVYRRPAHSRWLARIIIVLLIGVPGLLRWADAQETISFGIAGENFSFLPFRIAQEKGFYKKHGLNVQHVRIPGANVAISALVSGNLDYGTHYQVTMLWGARGLGTK